MNEKGTVEREKRSVLIVKQEDLNSLICVSRNPLPIASRFRCVSLSESQLIMAEESRVNTLLGNSWYAVLVAYLWWILFTLTIKCMNEFHRMAAMGDCRLRDSQSEGQTYEQLCMLTVNDATYTATDRHIIATNMQIKWKIDEGEDEATWFQWREGEWRATGEGGTHGASCYPVQILSCSEGWSYPYSCSLIHSCSAGVVVWGGTFLRLFHLL